MMVDSAAASLHLEAAALPKLMLCAAGCGAVDYNEVFVHIVNWYIPLTEEFRNYWKRAGSLEIATLKWN